MESQQFDYWIPHNQYIPPPTSGIYDFPSDISSIRSTSGSPTSTSFDSMPIPVYHAPYPHPNEEFPFAYQVAGMTPSDMGSPDDTPYCSPRQGSTELANPYQQPTQERIHTTSGRRRAQNRAAQRAFRERKEKHAKDLEAQLAALTERYRNLESSHAELSAAYEKLRKTIELLTKEESIGGSSGGGSGSGVEVLRKVLGILHAEVVAGAKSREDGTIAGVKLSDAV